MLRPPLPALLTLPLVLAVCAADPEDGESAGLTTLSTSDTLDTDDSVGSTSGSSASGATASGTTGTTGNTTNTTNTTTGTATNTTTETTTDTTTATTTGNTTGGGGECQSEGSHSGQATWYELATPLVNCSYPTGTLPQYYGAMNTAEYEGSGACGGCVRVWGPDGQVDIQIVDQCPFGSNPICYEGHIDLNPPAFDVIGDPNDGIIPITWEYISCDSQGGMQYHFKEGSSEFWTAIMVRNHRNRIDTVEYDTGGGNYKALVREEYNFFLDAGGMGQGPYTLRLTDVYGNQVIESGVQLSDGGMHQGTGQFDPCE